MRKSRTLLPIVLALFFALPLWSATELLRNGNFKKLNAAGLPVGWEARDLTAKVRGNSVKLSGKGFFVQNSIPLEVGENYVLRFEVRSDCAAKFIAYCEWNISGEYPTASSGLQQQTASGEWTPVEIHFVYGSSPKEPYRAWVAIMLQEGNSIEFRNLSLQALEPDSGGNLIRNGNFARIDVRRAPQFWEQAGFTARKNAENSVLITGSGYFINRFLAMTPGKKYTLRWEVRSAKKCNYRVYLEWKYKSRADGHSTGYEIYQATPDWQACERSFTFDSDAIEPLLCLNPLEADSEMEFRNVTLKEFDNSQTPVIKALGGVWNLLPPAKAMKVDQKEALCIPKGGAAEAYAVLSEVPVKSGAYYTLSFETKSANPKFSNGDAFRVQISFDGAEQTVLSPWFDTWTQSFQKKHLTFTVPVQCRGTAKIHLFAGASQNIYFADFQLEQSAIPAEELHPVTLSQPFYRNRIYASMPVDAVKGAIVTGKAVKSVNIRLVKESKTVFEQNYGNQGETLAFAIPAANLTEGVYQLEARCDQEPPAVLELRKLPPAPVEVVAGSDRIFRVNGKPFFPVMLWEDSFQCISEAEACYVYGHNGFNLRFSRTGDSGMLLEQLNCAQKNHIMIMLMVQCPEADGAEMETWKKFIAKVLTPEVLAHPALFGYFLEDEPMWRGQSFSSLKNAHDYLAELDPYRPTWINEAPRGSQQEHRQYSRAAEIWGVDIYPVDGAGHSGLEDKTLSAIGKYVKWLDEAVEKRKPVWMTLQGFSWKDFGGAADAAFPTAAQNRYAIYDSLVEGSTGLVWWGAIVISDMKFYEVLFDGAREVHALSGLLVNSKTLEQKVSSRPEVRTRLMEMNGKRYLLAVNGTQESVTVTLNAGFKASEVSVFPEKRTIAVKNGAITDTIEAYGVRCYAGAELPPPAWKLADANPLYPAAPLRHLTASLKQPVYSGKANWIWAPDSVVCKWSAPVFRKKFTVSEKISRAELIVGADGRADVLMNGKKLGFTEGFKIAIQFDCTEFVKNGENVITIQGRDGMPPYAFFAELRLEYANGQRKSMVTDTSWQCRDNRNAVIIAPYGEGVWGNNTRVILQEK